MKVSLLKIGLALIIVGAVWISIVFAETEKIQDVTNLKQSSSFEIKLEFSGTDIGFYKVHMPEFAGQEIFVQILDVNDNVIQEQTVQTRMSVGYFDFNESGAYTVKVTNLAKNQVSLEIEFGNTNSKEMIPAGIMILVGSIAMIVMSYLKIKNYKMAQPDENIS
ncbi:MULTISPECIES: hypothetical protein [Nitrosopumilus]|uniref:GOLD domain-containing protein n=1 Tax=Nitrosopumilus piranensis TaxID=1582439 RepID=A0A0C5C942_9ARCH|nr:MULTISPECIES: hypothetical protein [Nitrosopumilus]AJM91737.1 conserved exported protein of unknown function [Nitrosopumilus piranensis]KAF6245447.1 hypothetical protein C6989_03170 [Nitrosopumilus sp. b2]